MWRSVMPALLVAELLVVFGEAAACPFDTYGSTSAFDTGCGPGPICYKRGGIYGTRLRRRLTRHVAACSVPRVLSSSVRGVCTGMDQACEMA
jgi:hypothetical protein